MAARAPLLAWAGAIVAAAAAAVVWAAVCARRAPERFEPGPGVRAYADCPPELRAAVDRAIFDTWPQNLGPDASERRAAAYVAENLVAPPAVLLVKADGRGRLVGFVSVDAEQRVGNLYVAPELRRRGEGTALLRLAERYVASRGFSVAELWCDPSLTPFYQARGWIQTGSVRTGPETWTDILHAAL